MFGVWQEVPLDYLYGQSGRKTGQLYKALLEVFVAVWAVFDRGKVSNTHALCRTYKSK